MGSELVRRPSIAAALEQSRVNRGVSVALAIQDGSAAIAENRIANGHRLARHAALDQAMLHEFITAVSHEKPQLEMELRQLQHIVGMGAANIIFDYLNG